MPRAIIHIDMDAFFASVEQRDDPRLRHRPVIVGGPSRRGVVLAASYEARPFGVKSAMPMARAMKLAPQAIVVPPRSDAYVEASEAVFAIFESVTPLVEPLSLDEAFLDVTHSRQLFGEPEHIASELRRRIRSEVGLPASAGIAAVKFVAKMASDLAKPDGQKNVPESATVSFLAPLPVARLWGVGPKTERILQAHGLFVIGDVAKRDVAWLEEKLGSLGRHLWELSRGIDDRPVVADRDAKSIGAEDTFEADLRDVETLARYVHAQALRVARRLRKIGQHAGVIELKLKFSDFSITTRQAKLSRPTNDGQELFRSAMELFERSQGPKAIRLTGVSAHRLTDASAQLSLFESDHQRMGRLNETLDTIAEKFGTDAIAPADIVGGTRGPQRRG